jgi:hypothetical protein
VSTNFAPICLSFGGHGGVTTDPSPSAFAGPRAVHAPQGPAAPPPLLDERPKHQDPHPIGVCQGRKSFFLKTNQTTADKRYIRDKTRKNDKKGGIMGSEKRQHERKASDLRSVLVFDNREVAGQLANLSAGGVFLQIGLGDCGKIAAQDVGQPVVLRMEHGNSSVSQRGTICRYAEDRGDKYVAVRFVGTPRAYL